MSMFSNLLGNLPEVKAPEQKRLPFNIKLKWTFIILLSFFILGVIPLFGLGQNALSLFFILFEAMIYVLLGGLAPAAVLPPAQYKIMQLILIFQLCVGGILILFMDEVVSKWGF